MIVYLLEKNIFRTQMAKSTPRNSQCMNAPLDLFWADSDVKKLFNICPHHTSPTQVAVMGSPMIVDSAPANSNEEFSIMWSFKTCSQSICHLGRLSSKSTYKAISLYIPTYQISALPTFFKAVSNFENQLFNNLKSLLRKGRKFEFTLIALLQSHFAI